MCGGTALRARKVLAGAAFLILSGTAASASTTVFNETFASGAASPQIGGAGTVTSVGGYSGSLGFADNFLVNTTGGDGAGGAGPGSATTLSLSGLGTHTALKLSFDLALIDSWDGAGGAFPSGDFFNVHLDGAEIFKLSVDNAQSIHPELVPATASNRLPLAERFGTVGSFYLDSGFKVAVTVPHSSSAAVFSFFASGGGWQGGADDESWAIDNLRVEALGGLSTVPLPASLPLLGGALVGFGLLRRRRAG